MIFVDADDFSQINDGKGVLEFIHEKNPAFKVTLFSIVGDCSHAFMKEVAEKDWVRMVPHGWFHETSRECEHWSYEKSFLYLLTIAQFCPRMLRGFKAPGWQISDGMYQALDEGGWWVADQHYNDIRRPKGLKVYYPGEHHYHIGQWGEGGNVNEISKFVDRLIELEGPFGFLGED